MFVFGTDGSTLRAWPVHTIKSVSYNPKLPELAVHLLDGTVAWLKGAEAQAAWNQICAKGIGLQQP
jgi:hypothetical protein